MTRCVPGCAAPNDDGGDDITLYMLRLYVNNIIAFEVNSTTTGFNVRGLQAATDYAVTVAGVNAVGVGEWSDPVVLCTTGTLIYLGRSGALREILNCCVSTRCVCARFDV